MKRNGYLWVLLLLSAVPISAQQAEIIPVNLPLPEYPPITVQAHILGPVQMELTIEQDGSVKAWRVVSGPPMLARAVTDSLPQARFACEGCGQGPHVYQITYDFVLPDHSSLGECHEFFKTGHVAGMPPSTLDSPHHATIRPTWPVCMTEDPSVVKMRVRSVRCLWLWKCAWRQVPEADSAGTP